MFKILNTFKQGGNPFKKLKIGRHKPTSVICKRGCIQGVNNYYSKSLTQDNRTLVAGEIYQVIYNINDTDDTFTVCERDKKPHLYYMYGEDEDNNYNLTRTYAKWFYTPKELAKKRARKILKDKYK